MNRAADLKHEAAPGDLGKAHPKEQRPNRKLGLLLAALLGFLAVVAVACIAGFLWLYARHPGPNQLDFEVAKALLQMGMVSVVAAIVSLLGFNYQTQKQADQSELAAKRDTERQEAARLAAEEARLAEKEHDERRQEAERLAADAARRAEKEHDERRQAAQREAADAARRAEKERDERRQEMRLQAEAAVQRADYVDDLLKTTLKRITSSYNAAKLARRQLRALARRETAPGKVAIRTSVYDEWMANLNDAQLDLEAVKRDIDVSRGVYPWAMDMFDCVKQMEEYLREVRKEYEEQRWKAEDKLIPLRSLKRLSDFIGRKPAGKKFNDEFVEQYASLRRMVRENLMNARFVSVDQSEAAQPH